jgi:hypothetical protein
MLFHPRYYGNINNSKLIGTDIPLMNCSSGPPSGHRCPIPKEGTALLPLSVEQVFQTDTGDTNDERFMKTRQEVP